jgi:hypothetical protein
MTSYSTSTRWDSAPSGSADKAFAYATAQQSDTRGRYLRDMLDTFYKIGPLPGVRLNPDMMVAHSAHETGNPATGRAWQSQIWKERGNPSGLGVTDSLDHGIAFISGEEAALAHMVHLYAYVHGRIPAGSPLAPHTGLDKRYELVAGNRERAGKVKTLADTTGFWWTDPAGHTKIATRLKTMFPDGTGEESPMSETIVFGRVPKPKIENMIIAKRANGDGFNYCPPRTVIGGCRHITAGLGTIEWYRSFFGIGGQREHDALVDFIIDRDGRIAMFNDPFGDRAPWASGGSDGLEGDGAAFYNKYGALQNHLLFSVEHIGRENDTMTPVQLAASVHLWAWFADGASNHPRAPRVPYSSYRINPATGLSFDYEHWEFATKSCPAGMRSQTEEHQAGVVALLKKWQTSAEPDTEAPPDAGPVAIYPPGMTIELARRFYGTLKVDWAKAPFVFDPTRSECKMWLDHGKRQLKPGETYDKATWPKLEDVIRRGDGSRVFYFDGGLAIPQADREA